MQVYYDKKSLAAKVAAFVTWATNTACRAWTYTGYYSGVSDKIDPADSLIFIGECFSEKKRTMLKESGQGFLQLTPTVVEGKSYAHAVWNWLINTGRCPIRGSPPRVLGLAQEIDEGVSSPLHDKLAEYLKTLPDAFKDWPALQHMVDAELLETIANAGAKSVTPAMQTRLDNLQKGHRFKTKAELAEAAARRAAEADTLTVAVTPTVAPDSETVSVNTTEAVIDVSSDTKGKRK